MTLESFQMYKAVDIISRMLPLFAPGDYLDNELYFNILLRNITSETMQYILYNIKVQNYILIESKFLKIIRHSIELPSILQLNLWKIVHAHSLK